MIEITPVYRVLGSCPKCKALNRAHFDRLEEGEIDIIRCHCGYTYQVLLKKIKIEVVHRQLASTIDRGKFGNETK